MSYRTLYPRKCWCPVKRINRTQQRISELQQTVDKLQIVDRQITGDRHAMFALRGPTGSLIGTTCVTALPCHHVAVIGDLTTIVFATYGRSHWRSAICQFYRGGSDRIGVSSGGIRLDYVLEKAYRGMDGFAVTEFSADQAIDDLRELFIEDRRNAWDSEEEPRYSWEIRKELLRTAKFCGESALYGELYEYDSDFNDRTVSFGHRPKVNVLAGALVLNRLCLLLDQEEPVGA